MFNYKELIAYLKANSIPTDSKESVRRGLLGLEWASDDVATPMIILESGGLFPASQTPSGTGPTPQSHLSYGSVAQSAQTSMAASVVAPRPAAPHSRMSASTLVEADRVKKSVLNRINTNAKLDPASINKLLGVDVDFTEETTEVRRVLRTPRMTGADQFVALLMASLLSAGILFGAMYHYQFGLFHHTSSFASYLDTRF